MTVNVTAWSLPSTFDDAMNHLKTVVFKNRVRLNEFLQDFDKLRSGYVHENHFVSGLSIAGMDRFLSPTQVQVLTEAYRVQRTPNLQMVAYRDFVEEVETIFTLKGLEKCPLREVPAEPSNLLDRTRYQMCAKDLGPEKEAEVQTILASLREKCVKKGILVKPFFDDASRDPNSCKVVGHVTVQQFKQGLNVKLGLEVSEADTCRLVEKFVDDAYGDLINYIVFASTVDPPEEPFDPYMPCK